MIFLQLWQCLKHLSTQTSTHSSSTFAREPTYFEVPLFAIEKGKHPFLFKVPSLVMFGANFDEVIPNEP